MIDLRTEYVTFYKSKEIEILIITNNIHTNSMFFSLSILKLPIANTHTQHNNVKYI